MPKPIYATFAGTIDQGAVARIFQAIAAATNADASEIHLVWQSSGGVVGDGVALYNAFKHLPIPLHLYNVGDVGSIGVIAFLGGKHRHAAATASFRIHRTRFQSGATEATGLRNLADIADAGDKNTRLILEAELQVGRDELDGYLATERPISAADALRIGLVSGIRDFAPPAGEKLFAI